MWGDNVHGWLFSAIFSIISPMIFLAPFRILFSSFLDDHYDIGVDFWEWKIDSHFAGGIIFFLFKILPSTLILWLSMN